MVATNGAIPIKDLRKAIVQSVKDYNANLHEKVEVAATKNARLAVKLLRSNSPRKFGQYEKGWRLIRHPKRGTIVYNKTNYQLIHLLEEGHKLVDKKGRVYGKARPYPHFKNVEDYTKKTFLKDVIEIAGGKQ